MDRYLHVLVTHCTQKTSTAHLLLYVCSCKSSCAFGCRQCNRPHVRNSGSSAVHEHIYVKCENERKHEGSHTIARPVMFTSTLRTSPSTSRGSRSLPPVSSSVGTASVLRDIQSNRRTHLVLVDCANVLGYSLRIICLCLDFLDLR
jgi:hypothetical protein